MLHAVIMAGGSGTRFWPASRRRRPKQLLSLIDRPLLRATFDRILPLVPPERIWVVTTAATAAATLELLPELAPQQLLAEPVGRDTAACAGYASHAALRHDPDAVCAVLPADHVIGEEESFRNVIAAGAELIGRDGGLLAFGVRPTRAETGYGYLKLGEGRAEAGAWTIHELERFVEKPDAERARRYLDEGGYLWNSGIFVWSAAGLLEELRRQLPELAAGLVRIADAMGTPSAESTVAEVYPDLPRISVDYGVMEDATRRWVIPVDFPWSDVGSWPALRELIAADEDGNAVHGPSVAVGSANNLVYSDGPVVALAGVRDLIVVATGDAVLVVPAEQAQRVKEIVAELEARGLDDVL
jgi:mannose-1-phosphate guanylyltransferase